MSWVSYLVKKEQRRLLEELMPSSDEVMTPEGQSTPSKGVNPQVNRHEIAYNILMFRILMVMDDSNMDSRLRKDLIKALARAAGELT